MIDPRTLERIKKVLRLAEGGSDGERKAAAKQLESLLQKFKLTKEQVESSDAKKSRIPFKVNKEVEKRLLIQIIAKITGDIPRVWVSKSTRNTVFLDLTEAQKIEVEWCWPIYRKALDKEMELTLQAFVQANRLFREREQTEGVPKQNADEAAEVLARAGLIQSTPILRDLADSTN